MFFGTTELVRAEFDFFNTRIPCQRIRDVGTGGVQNQLRQALTTTTGTTATTTGTTATLRSVTLRSATPRSATPRSAATRM